MKFINYFKIFALAALIFSMTLNLTAQSPNLSPPRENKLLNNLRLLVWNDPKADKISLKIRIHSGSAFDPLGKEGVMQLLSDILFPNEQTREFFTEDLNGSFNVFTNYDYVQINATADSDKFLTVLETLAPALTNPQINKENTERIRAALLSRVKELEKQPSYIADQSVGKRLLGSFPYGRPQLGTSESLAKIDFADLLLAKERFLTSDNSTIVIKGNVNPDYALRATKRLFGGWLKADKKIPSTFAQPAQPKSELQVLDASTEKTSEIRFAMRGFARNDKDYYASQILGEILRNRLNSREGEKSFVRQDSNLLPGIIVMGVSDWNINNVKKVGNQIALPADMATYQSIFLKDQVSQQEFEKGKSALAEKINKRDTLDYWLDAETYKFNSVKEDWQMYQSVSQADVQKVLENLQKAAVASVLLVSTEKPVENSASTNN